MDVRINDAVTNWCAKHNAETVLTNKCTEAYNNDLTGWREVKARIYDTRADSDYRIVAVASGDSFEVKAIYRHANSGGKTYVVGERVVQYGKG